MVLSHSRKILVADFTYGTSHIATYLGLYSLILDRAGYSVRILCHQSSVKSVEQFLDDNGITSVEVHSTREHAVGGLLIRAIAKFESLCRKTIAYCSMRSKISNLGYSALSDWIRLKLFLRGTYVSQNVDLVIFPLANGLYISRSILWKSVRPTMWCAMLLGTRSFRELARERPLALRGSCFNDSTCQAILTLVDEDTENLKKLGIDVPVIRVPDITCTRTSAPTNRIQNIIAATEQKKIILLIGMLDPRKGVLTLLRAAGHLPNDYCIVLVGELRRDAYGSESIEEIDKRIECDRRIHFSPGWLDNESDINALVLRSSVVYLCYENFEGSSNMLTKAAVFRRPVITLRNSEMGRRTEQFNLGLAVESTEPCDLANSLKQVLEGNTNSADFDGYLASFGNVDQIVAIVDAIMKGTGLPIDKQIRRPNVDNIL